MILKHLAAALALSQVCLTPALADPVHDPGPRGGAAGAGGPLLGLSVAENDYFAAARVRFQEIDSVSGTLAGEAGVGLGPRFNGNSCAMCHIEPAVGGSSPASNPQVALASLDGAQNKVPFFVTKRGPVREARFVHNPDGSADGGVHDLYVITGRIDAPGCQISQPDFDTARAQNNIIFRIPTPLFGLGQVESTPDSSLIADAAALASLRAANGIAGHFHHSGNDGTIARFGWKAQNKSLLLFVGEAYNVEQGVTNEIFPDEREGDPHCQFNGTPEDATNLSDNGASNSPASDYSSDIVNFAAFARLLAGPTPAAPTPSSTRGQQVFTQIGCHLCHIPRHTTGASSFTGQSHVDFFPYSDFELHAMGNGLADHVSQGEAAGNEFRTAPLWGVGQRLFFLHDGRTSDLLQAIEAHASNGSEANSVIGQFNALPDGSKQDLLNFLRSL
ncbi:MAG TPA: di-heme oxidoredictase family protein [Stellaceae bacterium]|nr:di-heme oxidoredictase family protein [Stellaceae bacterium]